MRKPRETRRSSIVDSFRVPATGENVAIDAHEQSSDRDVPLFTTPMPAIPPIAGVPPWARGGLDLPMRSAEADPYGNVIAHLNSRFKWRAKHTERRLWAQS